MFDGIKIKCEDLDPEKWLKSDLLNFSNKVNTDTGEILSSNKIAFYNGLIFTITESPNQSPGFLLSVRGSLAKFYNNGLNNCFDFDYNMLKTSIKNLENKFFINPKTAQVSFIEYGANIEVDRPIKAILNSIRTHPTKELTGLKIEGFFNGLQLDKQNYKLKIYDKGKQTGTPKANILRIELVLKYSKETNIFGIKYLVDLLDKSIYKNLFDNILKQWNELIYYDGGMLPLKQMTTKERERFLYYLDGTNWNQFSRMQRLRAKRKFDFLKSQYTKSKTQTEIEEKLKEKLLLITALKCYKLQKDNPNQSKPAPTTTPANQSTRDHCITPRTCTTCKAPINHKKQSAVYCSKRCNNSHHAKNRKRTRHQIKAREKTTIKPILSKVEKLKKFLIIEYKSKGETHADTLHTSEINAPKEWILKVFKVQILGSKNAVFTAWNAKKLIKEISKINEHASQRNKDN